jgi:hypothetical protein
VGRGLCSASIDYDRLQLEPARPVTAHRRNDMGSESDVFKDVRKSNEITLFATIRARMEAAAAAGHISPSPASFDDQFINPPLLINRTKTHFDYDEVHFLLLVNGST